VGRDLWYRASESTQEPANNKRHVKKAKPRSNARLLLLASARSTLNLFLSHNQQFAAYRTAIPCASGNLQATNLESNTEGASFKKTKQNLRLNKKLNQKKEREIQGKATVCTIE
jgi:hypothetical protein